MIHEQFKREIKKGTGKAILLFKENPKVDFSNEIFHACVENLDYDPQCSGGRGQYLYDMIQMMKTRSAFEKRILDQLIQPNLDYWGMDQLFEIAKLMAKSGNDRALKAMYKKYEQLCKDENEMTGSYEIIEANGLEGLAFIAELHGKMLLEHEDSWEDGAFIQYADEELKGQEDPNIFLKRKAKDNKYIKAYLDAVEKHNRKDKKEKRLKPPSYLEIKKQIESDQEHHFYRVRRMNVEVIERLAMDFQKERNEKWIENYLRVFVQVKYPLSYKDILKHAQSGNEDVCSWSIFALKHFKNEDIRKLIDKNFHSNKNLWETFHLLELNYRPSDIKYIERLLKKENDEFAFHSMAMSLVDLVEKYKDGDLMDAFLIAYDRGYCANCRERFIRAMIQLQKLPNWITEEAVYDCSFDTRNLVKE